MLTRYFSNFKPNLHKKTNGQQEENTQDKAKGHLTFKGMSADSFLRKDFKMRNYPLDSPQNPVQEVFNNETKRLDNHFFGDISNDNKFEKFGYALFLQKQKGSEHYQKEIDFLNQTNIRNVRKKYKHFYNENLKSLPLVASGKDKYSEYFVKNSFLDKEHKINTADFWLKSLGESQDISCKEKADRLNNITKEESEKLSEKTIDHWFTSLMDRKRIKSEEDSSNIAREESKIDKMRKFFKKFGEKGTEGLKSLIKGDFSTDLGFDKNDVNKMLVDTSDKLVSYTRGLDQKKKFDTLDLLSNDETFVSDMFNSSLERLENNKKALEYPFPPDVKKGLILKLNNSLDNFNASKENMENIAEGLSHTVIKAKQAFNDLVKENPFENNEVSAEKAKGHKQMILSLAYDSLKYGKGEKARNTLAGLNKFNRLYKGTGNNEQVRPVWNELVDIAKDHWENHNIPKLLNRELKDKTQIYDIVGKASMERHKDSSLKELSALLTSPQCNLSTNQKLFLAQKCIKENNFSYRKFVTNSLGNDNIRADFVSSMMSSDNRANNNYKQIKKDFVKAVKSQEAQNPVLKEEVDDISLVDLYINKLKPSQNNLPLNEKLKTLSSFSAEELSLVGEKFRDGYVKERTQETFNRISNNYDAARNTDSLGNRIDEARVGIESKLDMINVTFEDRMYSLN